MSKQRAISCIKSPRSLISDDRVPAEGRPSEGIDKQLLVLYLPFLFFSQDEGLYTPPGPLGPGSTTGEFMYNQVFTMFGSVSGGGGRGGKVIPRMRL